MRLLTLLFSSMTLITSISSAGYIAHEWGTFTSLVGSNGLTQHGMYHEDEPLPDFVHGFGETQSLPINPAPLPQPPNDCAHLKFCFSIDVLNRNIISQKMETPVIYFYGLPENKSSTVTVDVKFPEGLITDTFPAPIKSSPQDSPDLVVQNGQAQFKVEILASTDVNQTPPVDDSNIYAHARKTASQLVRTQNETEKFIFYRGLGRFQPQINITSNSEGLRLFSSDVNKPSALFLISVSPQGEAQGRELSLTNNSEFVSASVIHKMTTLFPFVSKSILPMTSLKDRLVESLIDAGLFSDEAHAMIATWEHGYLKTPGLRLLYILPKPEVDHILPMTFTPAADHVERAFVARIEVMTYQEEKSLVTQIMKAQLDFDITTLGRFAEPRLRRAEQVYRELLQNPNPGVDVVPHLLPVFAELIQRSTPYPLQTTTRL